MTKRSLLFIPAGLLLLTLLSTCASTPEAITQDRQSRPNLAQHAAITQKQFLINDFTLHYAESGAVGKPIVVFIHGTPGSWYSLGRLMTNEELLSNSHMIAIDRPGWGRSLLSEQRSEPDFSAQSELIEPLLRHLKEQHRQPIILAGHSYGGSISPYLAWRNPELINGVLMAASAIDPELGKPRWYNWAASIWPISRLINERLQIANDEIWGVKDALNEIAPWWSESQIPLIYVQGEEDELVHPKNLDFAEAHFPPATAQVIRIPEQGHLLHVQQQELLAELTLTLINTVKNDITSGALDP